MSKSVSFGYNFTVSQLAEDNTINSIKSSSLKDDAYFICMIPEYKIERNLENSFYSVPCIINPVEDNIRKKNLKLCSVCQGSLHQERKTSMTQGVKKSLQVLDFTQCWRKLSEGKLKVGKECWKFSEVTKLSG